MSESSVWILVARLGSDWSLANCRQRHPRRGYGSIGARTLKTAYVSRLIFQFTRRALKISPGRKEAATGKISRDTANPSPTSAARASTKV